MNENYRERTLTGHAGNVDIEADRIDGSPAKLEPPNFAIRDNLGQLMCVLGRWELNSMASMSKIEINRLMELYIGSSVGYLGTFGSHSDLTEFFALCRVDVYVKDFEGTNKERFRAILTKVMPADQAKIIRGILERHPVDDSKGRTKQLHGEFMRLAQKLEGGAGVPNPEPKHSSEFVARVLAEVEHAIRDSRVTSGVDRVHSALHGYLRDICEDAEIEYEEKDQIQTLFKKLINEHNAFSDMGPRPQDAMLINSSLCAIMNVADPLRNRASFAHPTKNLLEVPEALLIINAARTILHYVDGKLADV